MSSLGIGYVVGRAQEVELFGLFDSEDEIAEFLAKYGWVQNPDRYCGLICWSKTGYHGAWFVYDNIANLDYKPVSEIPLVYLTSEPAKAETQI